MNDRITITLLEPSHLLQIIALALSVFNLIAFLWLACTVWLNGDRRSTIARVGVVGLSLSALFFFIHALLISGPLAQYSSVITVDFLWHLIWLPAIGVPYIWFVIGLHYAVLMNKRWVQRRPFFLIAGALLGCGVLLLLILNRATFTFRGTLLLLAYSDIDGNIPDTFLSPLIVLPILFLCYVAFCAIGPWFTLGRMEKALRALWLLCTRGTARRLLQHSPADPFWDTQTNSEPLDEPIFSWNLARPTLLLAALLMVGLTTSLGIMGVWSIVNWLKVGERIDTQAAQLISLNTLPLSLEILDIFATVSIALIVLLIGYSIVRYGILIERPLGRRGFFEQWRGIVIVATAIAILIALLTLFTRGSLGGMLLITCIAAGAYALFTWSSYTAHDRYSAMLGPFLRSTNVRHWLNTDLHKTEQSMEALFSHLCQNVLEVRCARLVVLSGPVRRSFSYRWPLPAPTNEPTTLTRIMAARVPPARPQRAHAIHPYSDHTPSTAVQAYRIRMALQGTPMICWVLPIYDELGLVAELYLGPRQDGGAFTDEDMNLAQACGQRILDTLRDHEAMLAMAGLLRRRIVDVKLLGAQQRRILHDEILPVLHLALLHLETARSSTSLPARNDEQTHMRSEQALNEAIDSISTVHRQLATMMRAMATGAPHRLERDGMMNAIHTMLIQDFQNAFDEVAWLVNEETAHKIDEMVPPVIAELIFAAVQEALRNAARHARGADVHRRLRMTVEATCQPHLEVIVADDGVGITSTTSTTTGTGGGLLTHSALLAIAGGSLTVKSTPGEGVAVRIFLPAEALR